jgi:hypothetical protein
MLGSSGQQLDVAEAALRTGIVWAVERGDLLSLRCAPQLMWYLADALVQQQWNLQSLTNTEVLLLRDVRDAIPYPFNQSLTGEPFEYLTLVSEACRRSLLAEHKTAVRLDTVCLGQP